MSNEKNFILRLLLFTSQARIKSYPNQRSISHQESMTNSFEKLKLSENILKAISLMGFEEPSPIQAESIPIILSGKDMIGQSHTGTGKTAAFAIPIIEKIDPSKKFIQAVVLCPTRELVVQVCNEFAKLTKFYDYKCVPIYGGQDIDRQFKLLKQNPVIIVATPGRLRDHIKRKSVKLDQAGMVILDEADEMLDMGFREEIEAILGYLPEDRQTILFSATLEKQILDLTKRYLHNPHTVNVTHKKLETPRIDQFYIEVQTKNKAELLARLIDINHIHLAVVFCNMKSTVDELVEILKSRGYLAEGIHGDMNQGQRDKVMKSFRSGAIELLVATDVAGRGIDVKNIEAVFNYDLPRDSEDYIHRIGRTGRAGSQGKAFSFITGKEVYHLKRIETDYKIKIQRTKVPSIDELEDAKLARLKDKINDILKDGHLGRFINIVEELLSDEYTAMDVAAALIKMNAAKDKKVYDKHADFTPEPNHREKNKIEHKKSKKKFSGGRNSKSKRSRQR